MTRVGVRIGNVHIYIYIYTWVDVFKDEIIVLELSMSPWWNHLSMFVLIIYVSTNVLWNIFVDFMM